MRVQQYFGDEYEQFMKKELERRQSYDILGMKYLDMIDLEVCNYVINQMFSVDVDNINLGKKIDDCDLVEIGLEELEKMGKAIPVMAERIVITTPIVEIKTDNNFLMATAISYGTKDTRLIEDSLKVNKFFVPENLYQISGYFFGHEILHSLKDVNYKEFVERTVNEVIPIFYEFVIYSPEEVLKKEVLKIRMEILFKHANEYELFDNACRENKINEIVLGEDKEIIRKSKVYEQVRTSKGCYLNSFYYALILYNMYKETPKKILDLVSKVLKHEMTTMEMLESLGVYGDIRGEVFEKELQNIKKLVK